MDQQEKQLLVTYKELAVHNRQALISYARSVARAKETEHVASPLVAHPLKAVR